MKIRTQLIVSMVIFGIALLIISASFISTNQQVDRLSRQEELAKNVELKANELSYLSNDYLLYHESPQLDRWESKYASLSDDVSNIVVDGPDQQALLDNIKADQQRLKAVFDDISSNESAMLAWHNALDPTFLQVSWSRIGVQTQGMVFDASRLAQTLRDEEDQAKQINNLLIVILLGTFIAFLLINYFLIYWNTIRSISNFLTETQIIGSGNLEHIIKERQGDEFRELSRAFNMMTSQLKTVTASKADLEKEVAERKRVEEELQNKHEELEIQAEELEAQKEELRANNDELETQILERKRAEEELLEAKMRAELYLDLMSHDINNLHQIALGYLELSKDMQAEGVQGDFLDKPIEVLQRSSQLIKNVRKLQKLKDGLFRTEKVDVRAVLAHVQSEFGSVPNKAVLMNFNGNGHYYVMANELLYDVFSNLVGNAIKHTGDRASIVVDLDVVKDNGNGGRYCRVMVEDDGPGIPDDFKGVIFNRALKGTTKAKGMGLGLYLVKSLVDSYGGRVWVEDRILGDHTKGAKFMVMLPAVEK
jgi:signal transduction histidine kinase